MTLRASVSSAEESRMLDGTGKWMFKVEVKRRSEATWTNLSDVAGGDWVTEIDADIPTPDTTVTGFTVHFIRADSGVSLAPGVAVSPLNTTPSGFSPLAYTGRDIRVWAYCAAPGETRSVAQWHPWLVGSIRNSAWPDDVVLECVSLDDRIQRAQIEEKEQRGSADPGTPMPLEFQGLLDRWLGAGAVTLHTEGDPEFGIGPYETDNGSLGDFLLSQARRPAWDIRYRWNDAENDFLYTLYLPPRDKTVPDLVLADVDEVPGLSASDENVRNAFSHTRRDAATRKVVTIHDKNDASIAEYGRLWMGITEDEDSPVNDDTKSRALLAFAKNDLGQPLTEKRIRIPFLPFLTLHHMIRHQADGVMFDFDQDYSVVGGNHHVGEDGLYTQPNLRGGTPVGMYYSWRRRANGNTTVHDWLIELVEPVGVLETATTYTFRIVGGDDVYEIWWHYDIVEGEPTKEQWDAVAAVAEAGKVLSTVPVATVTVDKPLSTQTGLLYLSPKIVQAGQITSPPVQEPARYVPIYGPQVLGPSLNVRAVGGDTQYTIYWSGDGVELSTDGVNFAAPPASPITVNRPAIGAAPLVYAFRGTRDGITATDNVLVMPLGVEIVPVDLSVVPVAAGTNNTQAQFTATAQRLDTMASVPVSVTLRGCSGTNNGVALPDGVTQTVAGPIIVQRPLFGQPAGVADFVAEISGVAFERIGRGIQSVQRDTVGPSLEVTPGTPTATTVPILWSAAAGVFINITWTSGLSVVFNTGGASSATGALTVTRPAAGSPVGVVRFLAERDGITNTEIVPIPPVGADTVTPDLSVVSAGGADDNYFAHFQASASNPRTGAAVPVTVALFNCTATVGGVAFTSGSTLGAAQTLKVERPAFGTATGGVTFSATIASAGEVFGGTATVHKDVPASQRDTSWPLYERARLVAGDTCTAWLKLVERGITVASVQSRTVVDDVLFGTYGTPTRGPGDASVVKGGTLGTLEYETDVQSGARFSLIEFRANLTGESTPMSVPPEIFTRGVRPALQIVRVDNQTVEVLGNDDVRSIKLLRTDAVSWETHADGNYALVTVPVPSSSTWNVRVYGYAEGLADVDGGTAYDHRDVVVLGSGATPGPQWNVASIEAPALLSDEVTIYLHATAAPPGHTMRVSVRLNGGAYTDITADIGGSTPIPTTLDTYMWGTGWTRGNPPGISLRVDLLAEILDSGGVVVTSSDNMPVRPTCTYTIG